MTNELTGESAVSVPGQKHRSIDASKIADQFPPGWMTRQSPRSRLGRSGFSRAGCRGPQCVGPAIVPAQAELERTSKMRPLNQTVAAPADATAALTTKTGTASSKVVLHGGVAKVC